MLVAVGCQGFLPPKHGATKSKNIDGHEIGREHNGPSQSTAQVSPASGQAAHEEYGIDRPEIWLRSRESHHETSNHCDRETDQFQNKGPRIRPETGTPEIFDPLHQS